MKESDTLTDNAVISQLQKDILLSIKGLCMKESNTLLENVVISQLQKDILLNMKGVCMKESNIFADNVEIVRDFWLYKSSVIDNVDRIE